MYYGSLTIEHMGTQFKLHQSPIGSLEQTPNLGFLTDTVTNRLFDKIHHAPVLVAVPTSISYLVLVNIVQSVHI